MRQQARGFTLIEIIATLMLLTFGLSSVIGMVLYANRISLKYQDRATAMATAETVLANPHVVDASGAPLLSLAAAGTVAASATGTYDFMLEGVVNGYFIVREEVSAAADIVDPQTRWAQISVHVYAGESDRYITSIRRRLLRRTVAP